MAVMGELATLTVHERQALEPLVQWLYDRYGVHVQFVVLFGSKVQGDDSPESDLDVLIVPRNDDPHPRSNVRRFAARLSLEYDLLISAFVVGRSHWEEVSRHRFPIYEAIQSEGSLLGLNLLSGGHACTLANHRDHQTADPHPSRLAIDAAAAGT